LQEETQLLPTREEVDDFANDLDHLQMSVDRLEARIQRLFSLKGANS